MRGLKQRKFVAVKLSDEEFDLLSQLRQRMGYRESASEVLREALRQMAAGAGKVYRAPQHDYGPAILFAEPGASPATAPGGKLGADQVVPQLPPDKTDELIDHLARAGARQPRPRSKAKPAAKKVPAAKPALNGKPAKSAVRPRTASNDSVKESGRKKKG